MDSEKRHEIYCNYQNFLEEINSLLFSCEESSEFHRKVSFIINKYKKYQAGISQAFEEQRVHEKWGKDFEFNE